MPATVVRKNEGIPINFGASRGFIKEDGGSTRNKINFMDVEVLPGMHLPPQHIHRGFEEMFYVLDGEIEFKSEYEVITATAGDLVTVPSDLAHTYGNSTANPARILIIHTDGRMAGFFQEVQSAIDQGTPAPQAIIQFTAKYNTDLVPPK
jgi:uncharacterized cupin superfamily protein